MEENLNLDYSEFQKRAVTYVIDCYSNKRETLLPSLFVKASSGRFKRHEMPSHFFTSEKGSQEMHLNIGMMLKDYDATHACFALECIFVKVKTEDAEAVKKAMEEGVEGLENKESCLLLSFEGKNKNDKRYIYRFEIDENYDLKIKDINEEGEGSHSFSEGLIVNLFKKE